MKKIHRYISFFLCFAVILFCISSPLRHTASAEAATISISLGGSVVSVAGPIAVAVLILAGLGIVWGSVQEAVAEAQLWYDAVPKIVKDWLDKAGQEVVEGHTAVKIPSTVIEGINSVDDALQLSPSSPYLDTSSFELSTLSPSDIFSQDVVGVIQETSSISQSLLRSLYGLLNTSFASLESTIDTNFTSSLSSLKSSIGSMNSNLANKLTTLDTSIGNVDVSVDALSSTLHTDLTQLKSSYASFGNETLSKLDTLNESIKAIDVSSSLSADFVDLRETIMEYDSLTLTAIQDLPDLISQSLNDFYVTQSAQLENISNKLGNETSYLQELVGDMQLVRDDVSNGFADVVVALDQLDSSSAINLQPVVDQLISSEATLFSSLDSIYSLVNDNFVDLSVSNNELLTSVSTLLSETFIEYFNYFSDDLWAIGEEFYALNNSILFDLFSSLEVTVGNRLETIELNLQDTYSLVDANVLGSLSEIKTAIQSIAGFTTAEPPSDDSDDDYEKEKDILIPWIDNGFRVGGNFYRSVEDFLAEDLDAFIVVGLIFEEFAGISFFYKLVLISISVGLVSTLLGIALHLQGYSSKRREEAAQFKAHSRMERSCAA